MDVSGNGYVNNNNDDLCGMALEGGWKHYTFNVDGEGFASALRQD